MRCLITLVLAIFFTTCMMAQTATDAIEKRISSDVALFESSVVGSTTTLQLSAEQKEQVAQIYRQMYNGLSDLNVNVDGKREVSRAYQDAHALSLKEAVALLSTDQRLSYMRNADKLKK